MAQADYVISPNPTGLAMRTEINQIFQAILTSNAGNVAPSTTQAGMLWGDTGNASTFYLKIRNHTNDGWASLYAYNVATKTIQPMSNGSAINSLLDLKAPLASPDLTGTPTAPTASVTTSTTQIASTAFATPRTATTGASVIPAGTTAQRPASPSNGYLRYNTELLSMEGYIDGAWGSVGGGATGGGTNKVFFENDLIVSSDYTITSGKSAVSAGDITINSGITVTVPTGSRWSIV